MVFFVISLFPEMFAALTQYGIVGRAIANQQANVILINPRQFSLGNYRRVDDRPFGGGPGMVMMVEPIVKSIQYAKDQAILHGIDKCPVVYLSPQGQSLSEQSVQSFGDFQGMILLCGRYEGIDERIMDWVDIELSIGDYVLSGGELPAMVFIDSLVRRLPKVMRDDESAIKDSFVDGLLDYPHYTRPLAFEHKQVPSVLLCGHHERIEQWRFFEQLKRTQQKRPDLYRDFLSQRQTLDDKHQKWLSQFLQADSSGQIGR